MAGTEEVSDLVSQLEQAGFTQISMRTREGTNLQATEPKPRHGKIGQCPDRSRETRH